MQYGIRKFQNKDSDFDAKHSRPSRVACQSYEDLSRVHTQDDVVRCRTTSSDIVTDDIGRRRPVCERGINLSS